MVLAASHSRRSSRASTTATSRSRTPPPGPSRPPSRTHRATSISAATAPATRSRPTRSSSASRRAPTWPRRSSDRGPSTASSRGSATTRTGIIQVRAARSTRAAPAARMSSPADPAPSKTNPRTGVSTSFSSRLPSRRTLTASRSCVGARGRAQQPDHHGDVADLIENAADPIGVGERRLQTGGLDRGDPGSRRVVPRTAQPASLSALAELAAMAAAADEKCPRHRSGPLSSPYRRRRSRDRLAARDRARRGIPRRIGPAV